MEYFDICQVENPKHYLFGRDPLMENNLGKAYSAASRLQEFSGKPDGEERLRKGLQNYLSFAVGFREAEQLSRLSPEDIFPVLDCESAKRKEYSNRHRDIFDLSPEVAMQWYTDHVQYAREQMEKDSVHYAIAATGIGALSSIAGGPGAEETTEELMRGKILGNVVDERFMGITDVLPSAFEFSDRTKALRKRLRKYIGDLKINERMKSVFHAEDCGQIRNVLAEGIEYGKELDDELKGYLASKRSFREAFKRFYSVLGSGVEKEMAMETLCNSIETSSRNVDYAKALKQLCEGDTDLVWSLSPSFRNLKWLPLAGLVQNLGLRRINVEHSHTYVAMDSSRLCSQFRSGNTGMPAKLLAFLEDLSGMEAKISRWYGRGNSILFPSRKITPDKLGKLNGMLVLGHGYGLKDKGKPDICRFFYRNTTRDEASLFEIIEDSVGVLMKDPKITSPRQTPERFEEAFGQEKKGRNGATYPTYEIPMQVFDLATQVPSGILRRADYATEALRMWVKDRGCLRSRGGKEMRYRVFIDQKHEERMRMLAGVIGLEVTEGHVPDGYKKKRVDVKNPEILGL